jgi:predicted nucleic acid-binding Zn finger protein
LDVRDTIRYVEGLTDVELRQMPLETSAAGLRKMVRISLRDRGGDAPTWIYIGRRRDHILVPRVYCTCRDFVIRVMSEKKRLSCKHLIIQKIAEANNTYRTLNINVKEYVKIIREILNIGVSPTARKLLYREARMKWKERRGNG